MVQRPVVQRKLVVPLPVVLTDCNQVDLTCPNQ